MKLLVIEDDPKAATLLKKGLSEEGYVVDVCQNGLDGLEQALTGQYDLLILDVMLPGADGWTVLQEIRAKSDQTPVLMLTARDAVKHRVHGLSLGADDYLVKPFAFRELLARVRAVLRRRAPHAAEVLAFDDLTLDPARGRVTREGKRIDLTAKEFALLELLLRHAEEILTRSFIAERVWDMAFDSDSNVVDVSIGRLRAKIDGPFTRKLIHTVRGRGYVIR